MDSNRQEVPLPPESNIARLWFAYRRLAFLISLVTGLILFFIWLPDGARSALFVALLAQRTLLGMVFLFALITLSLLWPAGQRLDTRFFLLLNLRRNHPKWLDRVMWLATQAGNLWAACLLAGLLFVLNYRSVSAEVILGALALFLLVETVKALTDRARPFLALEGTRIIGWRERDRSFPSGHTAQTFFLATLLSHRFALGVGGTVALYAVAVIVGFTRIYVGVHYPRDVIGGAILGSIWGVLAALVDPYWLGIRI
jgi:membrane-associated phospholipid phosphatase